MFGEITPQNVYLRMSKFITKNTFTSCCLQYCSQFLIVLHAIRLIQ